MILSRICSLLIFHYILKYHLIVLLSSRYSHQCSPCLVPYHAIIKLEIEREEEDLLSKSGLSNFISISELSKWIHHTQGGGTPDLRADFFKEIPCPLVNQLEKHFLMDLEMFEYDSKEYMKICRKIK